MPPDLTIESSFSGPIAGVDEAGRGPWAGPVVAAAVIFRGAAPDGIDDSKTVKRDKREKLFELLMAEHHVGVGIASVEEIDAINILQASLLAMQRAVEALTETPAIALIDGNKAPKLSCRTQTVVGGDSKCFSIAAASIIAKVTRDRMMAELARQHPHYGWETNAGYGTKTHQDGIARHGITLYHRKSFAPIRAILEAMETA